MMTSRTMGWMVVAAMTMGCAAPAEEADLAEESSDALGDQFNAVYCAEQECPREASAPLAAKERITGSRKVVGGRLYIETTATLYAPAAATREAIAGDWNHWWRHGKATPIEHGKDLTSAFVFNPTGNSFITVRVNVGLPRHAKEAAGDKWVYPVELSGDFEGSAALIVQSTPEGSVVTSKWDGIANKTIWPNWFVALLHAKAEAGTLPIPSGTGFPGLIDCLENDKCG